MVAPAEKRFLWSPDGARWYVRKKGRYHRILSKVGTPEFDADYWAIIQGRAHGVKTTWAALIDLYRASDQWAGHKPRTRSDYDRVFTYIIETNGGRDMTRVTRRDAMAAIERNAHRVKFANYIATVMSVLCEFAKNRGWIKENPVRGFRHMKTPDDKRQPHKPWPDAIVERWRAEAGPLGRLVLELGIGTVQRPADLCRFTWGDYDGDSLRIVQGKTGHALTLPCTAALRAALDAARPEYCLPETTIITGPMGGPIKYRALAALMLVERRRLGLEAYDLHGLRYRGVRELARAGCSDDEIAAYSGHSSKAMIRLYAGAERQAMRAMQAREKRG